PPRAKPGPKPEALGAAQHTAVAVFQVLRLVTIGALLLAVVAVLCRSWHRRRRARATIRWELRLGRDDLANPYRVQEMFEGIAGAIRSRWYERIWRGCDHFAVEIHWLPDLSIRFTIAAPIYLGRAIKGPLEDLYPDVEMVDTDGGPTWAGTVVRLKKRHPFVLSIQTNRNYEHAFAESLVALLSAHDHETTVQLVLTPAPGHVDRRARRMLKKRERGLQRADHRDTGELGIDSVVEAKELKGALELQHRSLLYFDLRVIGRDATTVKRVAGLFSQLRSENEFGVRYAWLRRRLYARRTELALPNPIPGWRSGVLSTSELATIWQLPRARVKHARLPRATVRRAIAPPEIERDTDRILLRDERGSVSIAPEDRKYGHALIGGQGGGKSSVMARHFANDARDPQRAVILIDPKGPLADLCLGLVPAGRTVHYMDLGEPEVGFNPLTINASAGARAAVFLQALIEANPPGAIQAASDSFLRQAIYAVCLVEPQPTLWHVYRMLDIRESQYRDIVLKRMEGREDADFARAYWDAQFPALLSDRGYAAQALNPPRNKIERLISTREIDTVLRHPLNLDLDAILENGEILIVAGAKASVGEDNTILVTQLLLQLLHRALQARQNLGEPEQRRVSLLIDEAHNVLTPSVAKMLAEGRSAGLEAVFAWQYSAQIRDEVIRSGVRSLLQSLSIFRMREMEDARSLAGLAMEVYSDRISVDQEEQERLRFSPDDIVKLPTHRALNVWVAGGIPRGGFLGATLPMEGLRRDDLADHHLDAQHKRGGHHPEHLPDPLRDVLARGTGSSARDNATSRGKSAKGRRGRGAARDRGTSDSGDNGKKQLTFIDVTDIGDRDDEL
ncbi:MAG: type IV secretory system conjugative DNA transfer family protein, partial [Actinobacteria bacterium]|nr:type IV secretory system conjugative DNA transfer family protein [Actinomycetota bacterium]